MDGYGLGLTQCSPSVRSAPNSVELVKVWPRLLKKSPSPHLGKASCSGTHPKSSIGQGLLQKRPGKGLKPDVVADVNYACSFVGLGIIQKLQELTPNLPNHRFCFLYYMFLLLDTIQLLYVQRDADRELLYTYSKPVLTDTIQIREWLG